jgi:hypothetical protein
MPRTDRNGGASDPRQMRSEKRDDAPRVKREQIDIRYGEWHDPFIVAEVAVAWRWGRFWRIMTPLHACISMHRVPIWQL